MIDVPADTGAFWTCFGGVPIERNCEHVVTIGNGLSLPTVIKSMVESLRLWEAVLSDIVL